MLGSKLIRTILILIGIVLTVSLLFVLPINRPAPTDASLITPPPRHDQPAPTGPEGTPPVEPPDDSLPPRHGPTPAGGGPDAEREDGAAREDDARLAAIYGQVIDLSTGQPGQGLEIKINGSIIRTNGDGRFSVTGLGPGTYTVALQLPTPAAAAQSTVEVYLAEEQTATLDLTYYSQPPPTPTVAPPPAPVAEAPAAAPAAAPEATTENETTPAGQEVSQAFSPLTPVSGGNPAVWINPGHINNEEGVTGNIAMDVANVSDFGAFQATLLFDPKIIQVEDVTLGNFLDSTGRQTNPLVTEIDNTAGEISFVAFTSGDTAGPNGGGTLAIISFTSQQAGLSDLDLDNVLLVTRLGKTINAQVGDGQISVTRCFGDLNGDEVIDVSDVQAVSGRVGQSLGEPNYILGYDLNNDNQINEADVTIVTDRLYETCS